MDPVVYVYVVLVVVGLAWITWDRIVRPFAEDLGWIVVEDDPPVRLSSVTPPPPAGYVTEEGDGEIADVPPVLAFERPERPAFVPPVQLLNSPHIGPEDIIRIDTMARLLAAGTVSESAAIVAVYDGRAGVVKVSKGGSAAYVARRNALRALAAAYGWRAPELEREPEPAEPRRIPINDGRNGYVEV